MYIVSCQLPHLIGLLYKAQCTVMNLTAGECNDGSYDGEVSIYHRKEMLKEKRPLLVFAGKSYCCDREERNEEVEEKRGRVEGKE